MDMVVWITIDIIQIVLPYNNRTVCYFPISKPIIYENDVIADLKEVVKIKS